MELIIEFIKEFSPIIVALLGGVGGWFLKKLDYNSEKKKRKAHLKSKLLDDILEQCRKIERLLNKYENELNSYQGYLDDEVLDAETGYPKNIYDFEVASAYREFLNSVNEVKEGLRHRHQNYVIKTKSDEIGMLNEIDKSLTKLISYDDSPDFNYEDARMEHLQVCTDLRMIHHQIKEVYPEEVPLD